MTTLHSVETEQGVIGACLFGRKNLDRILAIAKPEMFAFEAHRAMFEHIVRLRSQGKAVDMISLRDSLERAGALDDCGGYAAILAIGETVVHPSNGPTYALEVRDLWALREVERLAAELHAKIRQPEVAQDLSGILSQTQVRIAQVLASTTREGYRFAEMDPSKTRESMPSAFPTLNHFAEYDGALIKGQNHVYGAREGVGKSTALIGEALNLIEAGKTGCYYSLTDLNQDDIARRMMRQKTGWGKCPNNPDLAQEWSDAWHTLCDPFGTEFRVFTGRAHGLSIDNVLDHIRAFAASVALDFAVVDYLQALAPAKHQMRLNQFDRIAENARLLEALATELNIAVLVASQVTEKDGELFAKGGRDIMESAHLGVFFRRDKDDADMIRAHVAKMRFGRSAWDFLVHFDKGRMAMADKGEA